MNREGGFFARQLKKEQKKNKRDLLNKNGGIMLLSVVF